jgi:hypothetical protein
MARGHTRSGRRRQGRDIGLLGEGRGGKGVDEAEAESRPEAVMGSFRGRREKQIFYRLHCLDYETGDTQRDVGARDMTVQELIDDMSAHRVRYVGGKTVVMEPTEVQKRIYQAFGIDPQVLL